MGLGERLEDLTSLLIAASVYALIRWMQYRWPDPPGINRKKKDEEDGEDA